MTDLKGRTALVTGSTSGIGRATAIALAARGARVLVTGRSEQRAVGVVAEIERGGGAAAYHLTALDGAGPARDQSGPALEIRHGLPAPVFCLLTGFCLETARGRCPALAGRARARRSGPGVR